MPSIFAVKNSEAFVSPRSRSVVTISVKQSQDDLFRDLSRAKFQIETLNVSPEEALENPKEFWKRIQNDSAYQSRILRKSIACKKIDKSVDSENIHDVSLPIIESVFNLREYISIVPSSLYFEASEIAACKETVTLKNSSCCHHAAYKIRVSTQHVFVIKESEGFLPPDSVSAVDIVVKALNSVPVTDLSNIKISIEFSRVLPEDVSHGSKLFWKNRERIVTDSTSSMRKSLHCDIVKNHQKESTGRRRHTWSEKLVDSCESSLRQSGLQSVPSRKSAIEEPPIASLVLTERKATYDWIDNHVFVEPKIFFYGILFLLRFC